VTVTPLVIVISDSTDSDSHSSMVRVV
jgi:hypothetical protein